MSRNGESAEGCGVVAGSTPTVIEAQFKTGLRPVPEVGVEGDPIAHVEIGLFPPINALQNLLGVMGVAEYDDINPLSKFIHCEGPE